MTITPSTTITESMPIAPDTTTTTTTSTTTTTGPLNALKFKAKGAEVERLPRGRDGILGLEFLCWLD